MKKRDMIEAMKKTLQEGWPVPRWINAWLNNLPDDIEEKPIEPEPRPTCENWFYVNVKNKDKSNISSPVEKPIEPEQCPICENWFYMNVKNKDMSCLVKHEFGACCHFKDRQAEKPEPKDQPEIEWEQNLNDIPILIPSDKIFDMRQHAHMMTKLGGCDIRQLKDFIRSEMRAMLKELLTDANAGDACEDCLYDFIQYIHNARDKRGL